MILNFSNGEVLFSLYSPFYAREFNASIEMNTNPNVVRVEEEQGEDRELETQFDTEICK